MHANIAFYQILNTVDLELDVQEPFFSQLKGTISFVAEKSLFILAQNGVHVYIYI